ncbi:HpcH/HpaI aldolase/citrate lyase family protein [Streptomyces sp. NPDC058665]|uniref:HpcH/HpaI aldolase/citrate lyase family protein n=1 Tax=Streptomyces sp. NPDC058665 TaxID=3346586 RepID=UPI0036486F04
MRSALYVPGDRPDMLAKAPSRGADALIVDLEDAVPLAGKDRARATVAAWLAGRGTEPAGPAIWVRVNPGERGHDDVRALLGRGVTGFFVAKTESPEDIEAVAGLLADDPSAVLCPVLESAAAVLAALSIANCPRVARLQLGEADLRAELGVSLGPGEPELLWARSHVVLASSAAGLAPPMAPAATDVGDLGALRASTESFKRLGFRGRTCVHPAQLPVIHEVFTPTPTELADARDLVDRFDSAAGGAMLDEGGRLIDEAIVRRARRLLSETGTTLSGA